MRRRILPPALVPALLLALALGGCASQDLTDLETYMEEVRARDPGPIDPLPEIKQVATFAYEPRERRDPFQMDQRVKEKPTAGKGSGGVAPDPRRRKEQLEAYALDALRMVGTLEQDGTLWGLIRGPNELIYRVRVGNYMGMNHGQIVGITEGAIQLNEIVPDGQDQWRERQAGLALSQ